MGRLRDEVSGLQPDPVLALREEPVAAAGALARLHEGLVAPRHSVQVVRMVIVVTLKQHKGR
jgi:hypothetical protein